MLCEVLCPVALEAWVGLGKEWEQASEATVWLCIDRPFC